MRDFTAAPLNTKWCGDITCIPVGSTWLCLATVIDIYASPGHGPVNRQPHARVPGHRRRRRFSLDHPTPIESEQHQITPRTLSLVT
ncbi:hypothetical protein SSCG_00403 [Streptomyces clavuligerus]|nr:hypothetical protein SSCG_00403 [Streptomyces clavuligerus]